MMKNDELESLEWNGWPLPENVLAELGRITAIWNGLESLLTLCIAKLAGFNELSDPKPFILVNHASFPQRLDMFGALCEQLAPEFPILNDYKATLSALRQAQKARNTFVHNGISKDEAGNLIIASLSARGRLKTSVDRVHIADIRRAVISISEAQRSLYKLIFGKDLGEAWRKPKNS